MRFTVNDEQGRPVSFECADSLASRWTSGAILEGRTYPLLPFVDDVDTILDVGANCGATTVHFARHYPAAHIHAFEPGTEARSFLERNVASLPQVLIHPFGLHSDDAEAILSVDASDIGWASVLPLGATAPTDGTSRCEPVQLRSTRGWVSEAGIDHADVVKVDVEGCEVEVLEGLADLLPTVKVLYVEYDDRMARRRISALLDATHDLYYAVLMTLDQGECCYVRRDVAQRPGATERVREIFDRAFNGGANQ